MWSLWAAPGQTARGDIWALVARGRTSFVGPVDAANVHVDAGEKQLALDWLEKSFDARDPSVPYLGISFYADRLRQEPRYQALLRRAGLPQ